MNQLIPAPTAAAAYLRYALQSVESFTKGNMTLSHVLLILLEEPYFETMGKFLLLSVLVYYFKHKNRNFLSNNNNNNNETTTTLYGNTLPYYVLGEDTKTALQVYVPQVFDRAMIAARLQQQKQMVKLLKKITNCEGLKQSIKALDQDKNNQSKEIIRAQKLEKWSVLFRRLLVTIFASHYVYVMSTHLFLLKNVVKVITFVFHDREVKKKMAEERLRKKKTKTNNNNNNEESDEDETMMTPPQKSNIFARWWRGGIKNLVMEMAVERMLKKQNQNNNYNTVQNSKHYCPPNPFYEEGLGEEEEEADLKQKIKEMRRRREALQKKQENENHNPNNNEQTRITRVSVSTDSGRTVTFSEPQDETKNNNNNKQKEEDEEEEMMLEELLLSSQCSLSITHLLSILIPNVVKTAEEVVAGVLPLPHQNNNHNNDNNHNNNNNNNNHPHIKEHPRAHVLANMSEIINENDISLLFYLISTEMQKRLNVAEWMTENYENNENKNNIFDRYASPSRSASLDPTSFLNTDNNNNNTNNKEEEEEEVIEYPAGSTVLLDEKGKPMHRNNNNNNKIESLSDDDDLEVGERFHSYQYNKNKNKTKTNHKNKNNLSVLRQRHLLSQQQKEFFDAILLDENFSRLISQICGENQNHNHHHNNYYFPRGAALSQARSYDPSTGTGRLLFYAASLESVAQQCVEEDIALPSASRLFALELVRATCEQ
ncbi:hypothetical protein ADEAN_000036600 [Angomonas deanei]|uniref:Uncharacterized protein n=1 Tax=Angomonas deanei TaxID=59799 RepID=A0A7G2BZP4_9TRYP|nr:hypothetical protein ADEAN_000036600 [Angomonas deanei]